MTRPILKTIGYTALGALTAPVWAPLAVLGIAGAQTVRYAMTHPRATTAAVALAIGMTYLSSPYGAALRGDVKETIVRTVTNSQKQRNDILEERLAAAIAERRHADAAGTECRALLDTAQRDIAQYRKDRASYLAELAKRETRTDARAEVRATAITPVGD